MIVNGVTKLEKLIEAKNLKKTFKQIKAVNDITIDLNQGEVLFWAKWCWQINHYEDVNGFLTFFRKIKLNGIDLEKPNKAKLNLGYPEGAPAYGESTVYLSCLLLM